MAKNKTQTNKLNTRTHNSSTVVVVAIKLNIYFVVISYLAAHDVVFNEDRPQFRR